MKKQYVEGFDLSGMTVRTQNSDEMKSETAKIAPLWQQFYQDFGAKLNQQTNVYGVYSNYESDHNSFYDISAALNGLPKEDLAGTETISIASGNYLVFSATGEMPQVVMGLWQEIWQYFEKGDATYQRAYTTDFEHYKSANEIEIYIAITE